MRHAAAALCAVLLATSPARAAETWIEVRSAHFAVTSNAGEGATKTLAWQLEQIRSAIGVLWPWAKLDLNKPLVVYALKDEAAMKALAPMYWQQKNSTHPATVWVGGVDQNYLAIRTDTEARDEIYVNPYVTSYFSYVSLILQQSVSRPLPEWFSRGLAGVMSNTLVRDSRILLGPPIPWHLERLRTERRLPVAALLKVRRTAAELRKDEDLRSFDAESWAFVHFLMFGSEGVRRAKLDQFARMAAQGSDPDIAFREALGPPEQLDTEFNNYINRSMFTFTQVNVDASVKREGFTVTKLSPADAASRRALFHLAMSHIAGASAEIAEARKAGETPETLAADALLLDRQDKEDEAQAAYARAAEAGTKNAYVYYRLASLLWKGNVDRDTLGRVEQTLSKAVALNPRFAAAYAMLGEVRSALGVGEPLGMVLRAISLEPAEPHHHLAAANVLWRAQKLDDAIKHAEAARSLADTEAEKRRAAEMLERLTRAKGEVR